MVLLFGAEEKPGMVAARTAPKMPRQSSRLAEKSERHAKRKHDETDEEDYVFARSKGRRKSLDLDTAMKQRNSLSPKVKSQKAAVISPMISDAASESSCKTESNQQSDKYCHFCQVPKTPFQDEKCFLMSFFSACESKHAGLRKCWMYTSVIRISKLEFFLL